MSQLKCERCSWKETCEIGQTGNCLPDLTDEIPNVYTHYYLGKPKQKEVEVVLILGGFNSVKRDSYTPQFEPRKPDARWHRIEEGVASAADINRMGLPDDPIRLVELNGKYYVWTDGHRRVSVAKHHGLHTLKASVISLLPFRPYTPRAVPHKAKLRKAIKKVE